MLALDENGLSLKLSACNACSKHGVVVSASKVDRSISIPWVVAERRRALIADEGEVIGGGVEIAYDVDRSRLDLVGEQKEV